MSKERVEIVGTVAMTALAIAYMVVLIHQECPDCQSRWLRMKQWAKYHRWRAWFDALPAWKQEGLIVRGKGPEQC